MSVTPNTLAFGDKSFVHIYDGQVVSPESLKLVGGRLGSCTSMRVVKQNQSTTVIHEKLKEALLQGEEMEDTNLFRQLLRQSVRAGLLEAMAEEVEALCVPRYRPDPGSRYHRAGLETGVAHMDGGREEILRPTETCGSLRKKVGWIRFYGAPCVLVFAR